MSGIISDQNAMGEKADLAHEEIVQMVVLNEEERLMEKKLRQKIDSRIMPLVILVYLMNYIDR